MLSSWQEPVTPETAPWWEILIITTSLLPAPEASRDRLEVCPCCPLYSLGTDLEICPRASLPAASAPWNRPQSIRMPAEGFDRLEGVMLNSWQEPVTPDTAPWWEMLIITTSLLLVSEAGQGQTWSLPLLWH